MTNPTPPNGTEARVRTIVFREEGMYVAQCLEYDIAVQAPDVDLVLDRLKLTLEAELEMCREEDKDLADCISPAPNYYHGLWERRSDSWTQHFLDMPLDIAFVRPELQAA